MSQQAIEVQGMVHPDGTLTLDRRLDLPAGPVRVSVQPVPAAQSPDPARFQAMMERIWAGQKSRGHVPRTKAEIDAEIEQLRAEAEEELRAAERLHEDCQGAPPVRQE